MAALVSVKPNVGPETLVPGASTRKRKLKGRKRCSKCDGPRSNPKQRYCNACHAAFMREWRKSHPMTEEQKFKDRARSYANVYQRRGLLIPCPCENCGSPRSQKHHENYNNPLDVMWLCRPCHLRLHQEAKREAFRKKMQEILAIFDEPKKEEAA